MTKKPWDCFDWSMFSFIVSLTIFAMISLVGVIHEVIQFFHWASVGALIVTGSLTIGAIGLSVWCWRNM